MTATNPIAERWAPGRERGLSYLLVVLTHGRHEDDLRRTLASFDAMVSPPPAAAYVHVDGAESAAAHVIEEFFGDIWTYDVDVPALGFCGACPRAWRYAAACGHDYVFWLEHDFEFLRPVNLRLLADVLVADPKLAQMVLMRDAANEIEKEAGGLFESRPGQYEQVWTQLEREVGTIWTDPSKPDGGRTPLREVVAWLEHRSYFTTNPSLMRRTFMADNPWPDHPSECEGRFGLELLAASYSFGAWGSGEPWVRHAGARTGFGY